MDKEVLLAIRRAFTVEELDTIREPFTDTEGKKSKVQLALEKGLAPLGKAILNDDRFSIASYYNYSTTTNHSSQEDLDDIKEGGIVLAAEAIFRNYNQVRF